MISFHLQFFLEFPKGHISFFCLVAHMFFFLGSTIITACLSSAPLAIRQPVFFLSHWNTSRKRWWRHVRWMRERARGNRVAPVTSLGKVGVSHSFRRSLSENMCRGPFIESIERISYFSWNGSPYCIHNIFTNASLTIHPDVCVQSNRKTQTDDRYMYVTAYFLFFFLF